MASAYGLPPDDWQLFVLQDWLGRQKDGKWSSLTCGLSVPRQNGKNALLEMRELFGMVSLGEKFLHTAHEVKTARKAFLRIASFFENERVYPELAALVHEVRRTNGQECVILTNGGSVEFIARSKGSGRGFTVDTLVMDEAQELSDEVLEALMPTTSAAPLGNPQWIWTGTPPTPSTNGEVFTRVRNEALGGKSSRVSWHEWSCLPGVDMDSPEAWALANPALGIRLQADVIEGERARFSDEGFGRERLGMWATETNFRVIPADSWEVAGDELSFAADRLALGIEVGPDMGWASVALAGQREDGSWHIELDERKDGTAWVVPYVSALLTANPSIRAVACDAGSPTSALFDALKAANVVLTVPKVVDLGGACSRVLDGIVTGWLKHTRQPQMSTAAALAGRRKLGDTGLWTWSRTTATSDITPILAATLALWAAQNSTVKAPRGRVRTGRVLIRS